MQISKFIAAAGIAAFTSLGAQATVIDFEAHGNDFGTPIFDSGFQFDFAASGWGVFGPDSGACCDVNYNGTTSMFADGDRAGTANILMTQTGGGTFSIASLDAAVYWIGASGTIDVTGNLLGGGTVTTSLSVGTTWQSFNLTGFTNLVSVEFRDPYSGGFLEAPGIGIDNINLTPVPEPQTYALMLAGLALVGAAARRGGRARR